MIRTRKYERLDIIRAVETEEDRRAMLSSQAENLVDLTLLSGQVSLANTCVSVTESAIARELVRTKSIIPSNTIACGTGSTVIYPSSITDENKKATVDKLYNVITLPIIERRTQFTNSNGNLYSTVSVERYSPMEFAFDSDTDEIFESPFENCLIGSLPYICVARKANLTSMTLYLNIKSSGEDFAINTLKIVPFPSVGATSFLGVSPARNVITMCNGTTFETLQDMTYERSLPSLIPFRTIKTNSVEILFISDLVVDSLSSGGTGSKTTIALGVSSISGELNTYSDEAWIGFKVDVPAGTTRLHLITISGSFETDTVEGHTVRIYTNESNFNAMNSSFVYMTSTSDSPDITMTTSSIWILSNLKRVQGVTPSLRNITLSFT